MSACSYSNTVSAANETLPSSLSNFINDFYGNITKSVVNGKVVWSLPADLTMGLDSYPRNPGEGLASYFIRVLEYLETSGNIDAIIDPNNDPLSFAEEQDLKAQILVWANAEEYTVDPLDLTSTGPVTWPNGKPGVYTCTTLSAEWGVPDAYTITYVRGAQIFTVTQSLVTRNAEGLITVQPALTIV